jgi:hypothetical protein
MLSRSLRTRAFEQTHQTNGDSSEDFRMEPFPVDIDPKQIVRWIIVEHRITPSSLKIVARRTAEERQIPARAELHLGDEEREDLSEIAIVATLEIRPSHPSEGWLMTIVVEDEIGPRGPGRGTMIEDEQQIDLETFYSQFIRPERGTATVVAQANDAAAEARLSSLLASIETDRHGLGVRKT